MRWIRSNMRLGASSALVALAVQLILSFGHVHLDGAGRGLHGWAASTRLAAAAPVALPDAPALATKPAKPTHRDSNGVPGDYCAICAIAHLIGTVAAVAVLVLLLTTTLGSGSLLIRDERSLAAISILPFQARGPPIS